MSEEKKELVYECFRHIKHGKNKTSKGNLTIFSTNQGADSFRKQEEGQGYYDTMCNTAYYIADIVLISGSRVYFLYIKPNNTTLFGAEFDFKRMIDIAINKNVICKIITNLDEFKELVKRAVEE